MLFIFYGYIIRSNCDVIVFKKYKNYEILFPLMSFYLVAPEHIHFFFAAAVTLS